MNLPAAAALIRCKREGHRRDVFGYAAAREAFDARLPQLLTALRRDDLLVPSPDHACDPAWPGRNHTRECIPAPAFGAGLAPRPPGRCDSDSPIDLGQDMATPPGLPPPAAGRCFLQQ